MKVKSLTGQYAIITGSATGIGLGIAERLGAEGAKIGMVDIDANEGMKAVQILQEKGVQATLASADITRESEVRIAVSDLKSRFGKIDILVNNAGISGAAGNLWETTVEEMDRVYNLNLRAVFLMCKEVIPHMLKEDYGRIVNIASIAGKEGNPKMVPYSATKAGVIGLTKSVGKELAETGIRVNCVTPAVVKTKILDQIGQEVVDYMVQKIPMKRTIEISEVASLVNWLASPDCSASTGAVFDISGGRATY
jgi:NAD(P)-dependent dehydrogenase (short-subunit alcohol dehydrogenase family)